MITETDYEAAAARISKAAGMPCRVLSVKVVARVEAPKGPFLEDGRPTVLFERHWFSKLTHGRFDQTHPHISNSKRGGYLGGVREWDRLDEAISLDRTAALKSASWGQFQIMGFNFAMCDEPDVETFVARESAGDDRIHLEHFVAFVIKRGLADELASEDFDAFEVGYNGGGQNGAYAQKMRDAREALGGGTNAPAMGPREGYLRMGDKGPAVERLQRQLARVVMPGPKPDGFYGLETKNAVLLFQRSRGLKADGYAGPNTLTALAA